MIDVTELTPPTEYLIPVVIVASLFSILTAFFVTAKGKADSDAKAGERSDWDVMFMMGSGFAAVVGGTLSVAGTCIIIDGLDIVGAGTFFWCAVTAILCVLNVRWMVILIHEGPIEVLKDIQRDIEILKQLEGIVKGASAETEAGSRQTRRSRAAQRLKLKKRPQTPKT